MANAFLKGRGRALAGATLFALSGLWSAAGCVSIDDRTTVIAGSSKAGTHSQAGSADSSNGGSGSPEGGSGSTDGGSGSTVAVAGSGTLGGAAGSGGAGVSCGDVVTPTAARLNACIYSLSCNPLVPSTTVSQCLTYGVFSKCEATAKSCLEMSKCGGLAREPAASCAPTDKGWHCKGDVAVRCDTNSPYSVDCAVLGATCDLFDTVQDTPSRWPCKLKAPLSCASADPAVFNCLGTTKYNCIDGKPYGVDCAKFGEICLENTPGAGACTDRTTTCNDEPAGSAKCVGNSAHYCDKTNRVGTYDCTPGGGSCLSVGINNAYCLAPGCDTSSECKEKCIDAKHMQVCVGSAPYVIDCSSYAGMTGCVQYKNSPVTEGEDYVECAVVPPVTGR